MGAGSDILLIDDDRDLVNSLRIILESQGHRVRTAHSGKEGFSQVEAQPPDLIILDVMMSIDTEGFDLAFKLSRHPRYGDIPIIMLSGFPQVMAQQGPEGFQHILGEQWPVAQFLEKPVDPRELLAAAVQSMLDLLQGGYQGDLSPTQQETLERCRRRLAMLQQTINDLLRLAAGRERTAPLETRAVDLFETLTVLAPLYQTQAGQKGLELAFHLAPGLPPAQGDPWLFDEIFGNVVSNALKYTPRPGGWR